MHFSKATLFIQQIFTKDLLFVRHCSCIHTHTHNIHQVVISSIKESKTGKELDKISWKESYII